MIGTIGYVVAPDGSESLGTITDVSGFCFQVSHANGGEKRRDWFDRLSNKRMGEQKDFALRWEALK